MADTRTDTPARRRPAGTGTSRRAGLDHGEVVDGAMRLVEAEGPRALTMRRLAADLGVTTTTIYWHVGGRDELVLAVVRRLSERLAERPVTGSTPAERIVSAAGNIWESALEHPNLTALAHQAGAVSLLELPLEVALVRELEAAGLQGEAVRDALRSIVLCVAGFLVVALRSGDAVPAGLRHAALWAEVDTAGISDETLAALGRAPSLPDLFTTTIRSVVAGVLAGRPA